MASFSAYIDTNDTIYPDGYERERYFRSAGDMVAPRAPRGHASVIQRLIESVTDWRIKRAGRLSLREMSDDQLSDIGITRAEALGEVSKSIFID